MSCCLTGILVDEDDEDDVLLVWQFVGSLGSNVRDLVAASASQGVKLDMKLVIVEALCVFDGWWWQLFCGLCLLLVEGFLL